MATPYTADGVVVEDLEEEFGVNGNEGTTVYYPDIAGLIRWVRCTVCHELRSGVHQFPAGHCESYDEAHCVCLECAEKAPGGSLACVECHGKESEPPKVTRSELVRRPALDHVATLLAGSSCDWCNSPICKDLLDDHQRTLCKERNIVCNLCSKELHRNDLAFHTARECEERPVVCKFCGETYPIKADDDHRCAGKIEKTFADVKKLSFLLKTLKDEVEQLKAAAPAPSEDDALRKEVEELRREREEAKAKMFDFELQVAKAQKSTQKLREQLNKAKNEAADLQRTADEAVEASVKRRRKKKAAAPASMGERFKQLKNMKREEYLELQARAQSGDEVEEMEETRRVEEAERSNPDGFIVDSDDNPIDQIGSDSERAVDYSEHVKSKGKKSKLKRKRKKEEPMQYDDGPELENDDITTGKELVCDAK